MTAAKQPPPGVETSPGGSIVFLSEAATRLGKDPRTVIRAITAGQLRGGALPRPERLRWYVYEDELPLAPGTVSRPPDGQIEDLQAQVVSLSEANRLLIASQQDFLDADRSVSEAADLYREAADKYRVATDKYRSITQNYLDALSQFMTPGHLGELTDQT
jgi:hypothetical protein